MMLPGLEGPIWFGMLHSSDPSAVLKQRIVHCANKVLVEFTIDAVADNAAMWVSSIFIIEETELALPETVGGTVTL